MRDSYSCQVLPGESPIGALLRTRAIKQGHLAKELGVSQPAVSKWVNGGEIDTKNLRKIAEYFEVGPDFLLQAVATEPGVLELILTELRGLRRDLRRIYRSQQGREPYIPATKRGKTTMVTSHEERSGSPAQPKTGMK